MSLTKLHAGWLLITISAVMMSVAIVAESPVLVPLIILFLVGGVVALGIHYEWTV